MRYLKYLLDSSVASMSHRQMEVGLMTNSHRFCQLRTGPNKMIADAENN